MSSTESPKNLANLSLGALGVVYGDIGTSPLYAMKEVFLPVNGVPLDTQHIVGAVSVIFWALLIVVTLKYVILVLRANNRGEGGIMALSALAARATAGNPKLRHTLLLLGVFGAALFYGDSIITPAISVLGAVEGMSLITPAFDSFVLPISVGILIGLFLVQRHGTATVGKLFGPIIVVWFATLTVVGVHQIIQSPVILTALNPLHGLAFLIDRGPGVFAAFGAIVLALTGAEALYADMGHFGKKPIRLAWLGFVLPALAIHYMGQGALLISTPTALENPFYLMFPSGWLIPAVILATLASVIASQAVISGAYSMTRQAMQLGFLPRLQVHFTSASEAGQIFMPQVNRILLLAVVIVTIGFGSSSALASAYGIAVTGTMMITTVLTYFVVRHAWNFPRYVALSATGIFLAIDVLLVVSCSLKIADGGWFPLLLAIAIFIVMSTWHRGRTLLVNRMRDNDPALEPFIEAIVLDPDLPRVPRTAVYATASQETVPQALLHNLKHNRVLHEQNIVMSVIFHEVPWIAAEERVDVDAAADGFWRVRVNYGFMNKPDIPEALECCRKHGLAINAFETSYFLSRETVVPATASGIAGWREHLFAAMSRNAGNVVTFFQLPDNAVIELGTRVQI